MFHLDASGLAPDPTTVALRTRAFTSSSLVYGRTRANFSPPVVIEALPHVADVVDGNVAMDWRVTDPYNGQNVRYDGGAAGSLPPALYYPPGGTRAPIPGASPALNLHVCDGGAEHADLRVAQAVMRTDELLPANRMAWAQRFRVPEAVRLGWVELALGQSTWPQNTVLGRVAIFDGEGLPEPPYTWPAPLADAGLVTYALDVPEWITHYDFDQQPTLYPGRDYWLLFQSERYYQPFARILTGAESADFTAGIGPLHVRDKSAGPWSAVTERALSFRLMGEPAPVTAVETPASRSRRFALTVTPNPAAGAVRFQWTGGSGPVRLEVLDARGRRVAEAGGTGGAWNWSGRDAAGEPLPAGVYFVRARDGEGRVATRRVVRVP